MSFFAPKLSKRSHLNSAPSSSLCSSQSSSLTTLKAQTQLQQQSKKFCKFHTVLLARGSRLCDLVAPVSFQHPPAASRAPCSCCISIWIRLWRAGRFQKKISLRSHDCEYGLNKEKQLKFSWPNLHINTEAGPDALSSAAPAKLHSPPYFPSVSHNNLSLMERAWKRFARENTGPWL